ncbi:RelA/SpoT domain-containing protein [Pectobacterium versatile]|uniref:RelA/SpoT domain-containing protein n=1 Tax=Pectobacterium versatile TaxID=2488639 RepID=UPI00382CE4A3
MYELSVSKKEIGRAGDRLVSQLKIDEKYDDGDVDILHQWRMLHLYPLNRIKFFLERESKLVNKNSLISSRIKRLPSIVGKLSRFPEMKLNKMQDLGGCRAILDNIEQVYNLKDKLLRLKFSHKLARKDDYIENMKDSGYRSFHMVYSFQNDRYPQFNGLKIEIQIRTAIQHSWATAVEMVGLFRNESLKSSMGDIRWLRFFKLVSELFYKIESKESSGSYNAISDELRELCKALNVFYILNAYNQVVSHIEGSEHYKKGFCIILLDTKAGKINIKKFDVQNNIQAAKFYINAEKHCSENKDCEVAMVSVSSIGELKNAYPAYFLDTKTFLNNLSRFIF